MTAFSFDELKLPRMMGQKRDAVGSIIQMKSERSAHKNGKKRRDQKWFMYVQTCTAALCGSL